MSPSGRPALPPHVGPRINQAFDAVRYWRRYVALANWFERDREIAAAICLNVKHDALGFYLVGIGTLNECVIHARDVYRAAIASNSHAVILIHNHPSGDPKPSRADFDLTEDLTAAGRLLRIALLDHVVIGSRNRYASMILRP